MAFVHFRIYIDMFTSEMDIRSQELRSRTVARKEIFKTCWRGHFDSAGDAELATKSVGAWLWYERELNSLQFSTNFYGVFNYIFGRK